MHSNTFKEGNIMDLIRGASKVPIREEDKTKSYYHFYERELVEVPKNKIEITAGHVWTAGGRS